MSIDGTNPRSWIWGLFAVSAVIGAAAPLKDFVALRLLVAGVICATIAVILVRKKIHWETFVAASLAGLMTGASVTSFFLAFKVPIAWLSFIAIAPFAALLTRKVSFEIEHLA